MSNTKATKVGWTWKMHTLTLCTHTHKQREQSWKKKKKKQVNEWNVKIAVHGREKARDRTVR